MPEKFSLKASSCFVSDSRTPNNLRTFLTLYNTVYLNPPLVQDTKLYWNSLGVNESELNELIEMGRVKFTLVQPLHRYDSRLLEILLELGEQSYLTPRRLSAVTIVELRKRNPILFPTFNDEVKYEILHSLHNNDFLSGELTPKLGNTFLMTFSKIWEDYLEDVHRLGMHGLSNYSSYQFLDAIFKNAGKDYGLELMTSVPSGNSAERDHKFSS